MRVSLYDAGHMISTGLYVPAEAGKGSRGVGMFPRAMSAG